jgi:CBS domain-containing protein
VGAVVRTPAPPWSGDTKPSEEVSKMLVERILREKGSEVASVDDTATVAEALELLRHWNVGALVVKADGKPLAGILSERDIVRALAESGAVALGQPVAELMTADVVTVDRHAPLDHLMAIMTERRIRHVPVVEDGQLVGVVSIGDVVKRRVEQLETENAQIVDYISVGR